MEQVGIEDKVKKKVVIASMANTYLVTKSQLQAMLDELEQYKVTNKLLQVEVKTNVLLKSIRDDENCLLKSQNQQLELTRRDNQERLSNKDKEISCLKFHNQILEYHIRKSKNDNKSPYGSDNELEKEIRCINKLIIDKDIELVQVRGTLESQEKEIGRLQK